MIGTVDGPVLKFHESLSLENLNKEHTKGSSRALWGKFSIPESRVSRTAREY